MEKLLEVKGLKTAFYLSDKVITAVDGVSFDVFKGETLCIVGESGCGKSVTSLSIMRLVASPPGKYVEGEIWFGGEDLLAKSAHDIGQIRGKDISMIFQEPMTALNPVHRIGEQIGEVFSTHEGLSKSEARKRAIESLKMVGVPDPERCANAYPHQFSGGMRQRVMIAMAISCNPKLLIADEPTTALDVTIQAQILDLISTLKKERGMTVLFITHDLGVVAEIAQRILVMYSGKIVEEGLPKDIYTNPLHPYTRGLLECIPRVDKRKPELAVIRGQVPNPADFPKGCRFHPRCPQCMDICRVRIPDLVTLGTHKVACHLVSNASSGKGNNV